MTRQSGVGWPRKKRKPGKPRDESSFTHLVPVKLSDHQVAVIDATDTPRSQWIREAVEQRLRRDVPDYE